MQPVSYDRNIFIGVLGVVSAEAGLYSAFEKLQIYTNDPRRQFKKVYYTSRKILSDVLNIPTNILILKSLFLFKF